MTLKENYYKNGDLYVFECSDIQDLARRYYMRNQFDCQAVTEPKFTKTRSIVEFITSTQETNVVYQVKVVYEDSTVVERNNQIGIIKEIGQLHIEDVYTT